MSGKSQGKVMEISEICGCGRHPFLGLVFHFEVVTIISFSNSDIVCLLLFFCFFSSLFLLSRTEVFCKGMMLNWLSELLYSR